jgi:hypothetical protein
MAHDIRRGVRRNPLIEGFAEHAQRSSDTTLGEKNDKGEVVEGINRRNFGILRHTNTRKNTWT